MAVAGLICAGLLSLLPCVQAQALAQREPATGRISGQITISGKPAARVLVTLEPFGSGGGAGNQPRKAMTNDEGVYRLADISEGRYQVTPVLPAFVIAAGPSAAQAGSGIYADSGLLGFILTIARGEVHAGIDFALTPGGVITGCVTDAAGRPVIAAPINYARVNGQNALTGGSSSTVTETDDRGTYRLYGLPAGVYLVAVSGAGQGAQRYQQTFHPGVTDGAHAAAIKVTTGGEATDVNIQLGQPERSFTLGGRVVEADSNQPVPGAAVTFSSSERTGTGRTGQAITDAQGRFAIKDSLPGHYEFWLSTTGGPNQGYYSEPLSFDVTDADVTGLEIKARRGARISGVVVVEGTDDPALINSLAHSTLSAMRILPREAMAGMSGTQLFTGTVIKPGGAFAFMGLRPGRVAIRAEGLPQGFNFLRVERDGVAVTAGIDLTPALEINDLRVVIGYGTGALRGQARVEGGQLPARRGWLLEVKRADGMEVYSAILDAGGHFWLKGLTPGSYEVTATIGYVEIPGVTPTPYPAPIQQTVNVENGKEAQVSLVLDLAHKIIP